MAGPKDRVEIIDCTLRDGSYVADFQFTARDTESICRGLARAGIRMIEVGHGLGLGASRAGHGKARESDEAYLEAARAGAGGAKVGAFFIPGIGSAEDIAAARRRGLDFIRIGADVTRIESAREHVARARTLGLEVSLNMMKSYAVDLAGMVSVAAAIRGYGASIVTVVDSAGCMLP
ncbi:MAG: 4-hydroxy-2-oxovalerate aldolase, partial [Alphaproteobacteria bacterium]